MSKSMRYIFSILAAVLCTMQLAMASDIKVMNATAKASLTPTAKTGVVYFSVISHGSVEDRLMSVSTPVAASAEIHETMIDGDVMKMRELANGWEIVPGRIYDMKPGGTHVMLMGLKAPLKINEKIQLDLMFEKAGKVSVEAIVGDAVTGEVH
jgi:periplasmic copper chaperone A